MKSLLNNFTSIRGTLIGIVFVLLGIIIGNLKNAEMSTIISQGGITIGTTLIVASTIGYAIDKNTKKNLADLFCNSNTVCTQSNNIGMTKIMYDEKYNFDHFIEEEEEITIVMNDGKRWISNHYKSFEKRFSDNSKKTTFIFLKPDSDAMKLVARKTKKREESVEDKEKKIRQKIEDSIRELKEINTSYSNLNLYYSKNYNVQTIFLSNKKALVTSYRTSAGIKKTKVPLVEYKKNEFAVECEYYNIERDVKYLIEESEKI